ncbi:hypothetical protein LTR28_006718 [Elasticomyces elasticus]|nr:hypothetical protein LTR28_006718 [Elasticomyces elasticus]
MRANTQRPSSRSGPTPTRNAHDMPIKEVFNCIVDDTALVAGTKRSTRDGLRKWVANGSIRLFVPLHALERMKHLSTSTNRIGDDVRDCLQWLDEATSQFPAFVAVQGGFETFNTWAEVEKFALPTTLFSEHDGTAQGADALPQEAEKKLNINGTEDEKRTYTGSSVGSEESRSRSPSSLHSTRSSLCPPSVHTSPAKTTVSLQSDAAEKAPSSTKSDGSGSLAARSATPSHDPNEVPRSLRPLINYILWRVHQEQDPAAALESFIFLSNDTFKAKLAQRFGIRVKRLEQLREVVAREDRDHRNRTKLAKTENITPKPQAEVEAKIPQPDAIESDEEDVVLFKRNVVAPKPVLAVSAAFPIKSVDPNEFGRQTRNFPPRNGRGPSRGHAGFGGPAFKGRAIAAQSAGPIDPNSYARPPPSGRGGRGGKLWMPT